MEVKSVQDAQDMTLPREKFKAAHFVQSSAFFKENPDHSKVKSGLYLLDAELVTRQLPEVLLRNGVALGPDGSVTNQTGQKVAMMVGNRLVAIKKKQGLLQEKPRFFGSLRPTRAFAASPFPLEWVSAWWSWTADKGFCRSITARTGADAWGPIIDPWDNRVHTNIQQIETFVNAAGAPSDHLCTNCAWSFPQATNNFGCFWPAHGGGEWGWADTKDASFNWSTNW